MLSVFLPFIKITYHFKLTHLCDSALAFPSALLYFSLNESLCNYWYLFSFGFVHFVWSILKNCTKFITCTIISVHSEKYHVYFSFFSVGHCRRVKSESKTPVLLEMRWNGITRVRVCKQTDIFRKTSRLLNARGNAFCIYLLAFVWLIHRFAMFGICIWNAMYSSTIVMHESNSPFYLFFIEWSLDSVAHATEFILRSFIIRLCYTFMMWLITFHISLRMLIMIP